MRTKPVFLLALAVLAPAANAWNASGHRQIADMAWCLLDRHTKEAVAKILLAGDRVQGRDGEVSFVPDTPAGAMTTKYLEDQVRPKFALAATWPDQIKGGESQLFDTKIDADNAASPGVKPPSGDPHKARGEEVRCKTWHYYDVPIFDSNPPHPARPSNADRAMGLITDDLRKLAHRSGQEQAKAYDLYWAEHIVGDLHQPLHCSSSYAVNKTEGDAGGNGFHIGSDSLHYYWDAGIDHAIAADPSIADRHDTVATSKSWLADKSVKPKAKEISDLKPMDWIEAGAKLAETQAYVGVKEGEVASDEYRARQAEVCKRQAVLAAYRLARYLKQALK